MPAEYGLNSWRGVTSLGRDHGARQTTPGPFWPASSRGPKTVDSSRKTLANAAVVFIEGIVLTRFGLGTTKPPSTGPRLPTFIFQSCWRFGRASARATYF